MNKQNITKTLSKDNYIYKNFMPSEKGKRQETANDEHLSTFLARYMIEFQTAANLYELKTN